MPGPLGIVLGNLAMGGGGIKNTVAPAIEAAAVIGTEHAGDDGTWNPVPASYTYQWQRYTGGAWANIALATSQDYTPTDTDFGLALRLGVTARGVTAYSNQTNLVIEAPAQTVGPAELVTNGNMETGDPPTGWAAVTIGYGTVTRESDERTGGAGSYSLGIAYDTQLPVVVRTNITMTPGVLYEMSCWRKCTAAVSGARAGIYDVTASAYTAGGVLFSTSTDWNLTRGLGVARNASNQARVLSDGVASAAHFDDFSILPVTINTQLAAPSANMRLDVTYTLPASPLPGSQVWLAPRVSDWSVGDNWVAVLEYTTGQWDITLYSVAARVRTSRIAATNIGATNGIRVNANGDSISLWTTADGGTNWTQRGSTISNTTYNTATGVNALWTSDFTAGNLVYAAAD